MKYICFAEARADKYSVVTQGNLNRRGRWGGADVLLGLSPVKSCAHIICSVSN